MVVLTEPKYILILFLPYTVYMVVLTEPKYILILFLPYTVYMVVLTEPKYIIILFLPYTNFSKVLLTFMISIRYAKKLNKYERQFLNYGHNVSKNYVKLLRVIVRLGGNEREWVGVSGHVTLDNG